MQLVRRAPGRFTESVHLHRVPALAARLPCQMPPQKLIVYSGPLTLNATFQLRSPLSKSHIRLCSYVNTPKPKGGARVIVVTWVLVLLFLLLQTYDCRDTAAAAAAAALFNHEV